MYNFADSNSLATTSQDCTSKEQQAITYCRIRKILAVFECSIVYLLCYAVCLFTFHDMFNARTLIVKQNYESILTYSTVPQKINAFYFKSLQEYCDIVM